LGAVGGGAINATPLDLGLLRGGIEDSYVTQKLQVHRFVVM
jgi:hypothetical protein